MNQNEVLEKHLPEFLQEMKSKIESKESEYGDFTQYSIGDLLNHFGKEVKELSLALAAGSGNSENIAKEAVDTANLAFMLWWFHSGKVQT